MNILWIILQITGSLILAVVVVSEFDRDIGRWHRRKWNYVYIATALTKKGEQSGWAEFSFGTTHKFNRLSMDALKEGIEKSGQYDCVVIANVIYLGRAKPEKKEDKA